MSEPTLRYDCHVCGEEITVDTEWEPPESNWGADADGNRGIYIPGRFIAGEPAAKCPHCGYEPTAEELIATQRVLDQHADDLSYDEQNWPDYPEL